jgi:membrane-bound lytic murein transglycosylase D
VSTVARRYGVSVKQVQSWNKLSGSKLVAGQSLVLMLRPNSAAAMRAERAGDEDEAPAKAAPHGKSGGKTQAAAKSEKSDKVEKSSRSAKAEPRKRVVVEASPHGSTSKSSGKSATRESKSSPTPATKSKSSRAQ